MTGKVLAFLGACGTFVLGIPFPAGYKPPMINSPQPLVRAMPPLLRINRPLIQDPQLVYGAASQGNLAAQEAIYKMQHAPLLTLKQPKFVPAYRSLGEIGQRAHQHRAKADKGGEKQGLHSVAKLILEASRQLMKLSKTLTRLVNTSYGKRHE